MLDGGELALGWGGEGGTVLADSKKNMEHYLELLNVGTRGAPCFNTYLGPYQCGVLNNRCSSFQGVNNYSRIVSLLNSEPNAYIPVLTFFIFIFLDVPEATAIHKW